ncbi:hypothetical protein P175DRAFT_0556792 [Aspergillus ochraceoroseus IBT 24754]|uniref:Uncharacterized protein n=1 Tax=Aspergillus ochraceoroseus IBT 24754 TaxID=1392256 RepID=A0A2T5LZY5_9EURO|nr:uncharacterized protein P175DRAFT_0556792 [Aspergillus ochraceoroseus IBT 24754]PTU21836.1 hypothetical protein P175DRAFT_0556792 [Aspergillus ochraceoroseus IBT 24754]
MWHINRVSMGSSSSPSPKTKISSIHRHLLYLLSFSAAASLANDLGSSGQSTLDLNRFLNPHDQVVLKGGPDFDYGVSQAGDDLVSPSNQAEASSHVDLVVHRCEEGHSCVAGEQCCQGGCIPESHDCCSASQHCFPGDYCFFYEGIVRCCPEGMSCSQMSEDVAWEQTVYWYEEVHVVEENSEERFTSQRLESSVRQTTTSITVSASYTNEASSSLSALSSSVYYAAQTSPELHSIPTRTSTVTRVPTSSSTRDVLRTSAPQGTGSPEKFITRVWR